MNGTKKLQQQQLQRQQQNKWNLKDLIVKIISTQPDLFNQ